MQDDTRLFRPTRAALAAVLIFQALCPGLLAAPAITATKDDGLAAGAKKPAGSTVTYTNTISNGTGAGITDATGVQFADPDVINATYAPNTLTATPVAIDDIYPSTVIANTSINTATSGFSVVANDFAGYAAGTAVLTTALTISNVTTPLHGTLAMTLSGSGVGQFTYTPTAGYVGADSFTYTISNGVTGGTAVSRTASVNLTVGGPVIWFVNPNLGSNGTGILGNPFNNLAAAVTAIGANTNHRIFVYSGGADQTTATPLNSGAWLVGQAAVGTTFEALMGGISYPSDTTAVRPSINNATKPKLTRTGGNTVTLGENNIILGLAIGNTGGGYAVLGNNINAVQIGNATTSDVDLSSGSSSNGALSLTGGTGNITVNAPIATTAGRSVNIVNRTAGILSFPKAISDTGTGINLTANNAATISFTGGLSLSTGTNTAFNATGGGTITATQNNSSIVNTLATTSGTALNVANTTIGAGGITFRSISAGTGAGTTGVGISLNTTGSSGGLTVTGNGTAGSGGTIQRKTGSDLSTAAGIGIYLNNTSNVSLARMQLNDFDNFAIRGTNVSGFTLGNSVINSAGGSSWNGTNDAGGVNEGSVSFSELTGAASISNTSISGGYADNVRVVNTTGTLNRITIDTVTIGANHSGAALDGSQDRGNDGITLEALTGSAILNATVLNSTFTSSRGDLIQFSNNGTAANDLVFTGNHLSNNYPRIATGGGGVSLFTNGTGNLTLSVTGNDFRDSVGTAVLIVKSTGAATLAGTISNNTIGVAGVANSGSLEGSALKIQSAGGGTVTTLITGNSIRQYNNNGIELLTGGGASAQGGNFNATIIGNTIANPGTNPATAAIAKNGIHLNGGTVPLDSYLISLDIGGAGALANSLSGSGAPNDSAAGGEDIRFRQRQDTRVQLRGYTGTPADNAAVQTYAIARNGGDGAPSAIASNNVSTGTDGYFNTPGPGGPVTQPLLFATGGIEKSGDPVIPATVLLEVGTVTDSIAIQPVIREARTAPPAAPAAISQEQLDSTVSAAISRWEATGLTGEQLAVLRGVRFEVATLGDNHLGEASAKLIRVDGNAGGNGWFVDASPRSDGLFGTVAAATRLHTVPTAAPAGRVDLLTTIMHEMGHALGLADTYSIRDRDSIMYGQLTKGERRLPAKDQAKDAQPFVGDFAHFLSGTLNPITIGTLPPGKSVVITYDVTINDPFTLGATQISSQGTVSGTNFTTVNGTVSTSVPNTDDATVAGASDPTITLLDRPDTTVATIARASGSPTNASPVSWTVTFADAIAGLTSGNFSLVSSGLGGTPAITSVTPTGGAPATVWTVTASTGTGSGTLGLNLANDAALSHDVTNQPFTGQVFAIDRTAPDALITLSDTALKIGDTTLVTITFTETVTGFTNADLTAPNGTLSSVATSDNLTWTATFTPDGAVTDLTNVITLDKTGVTDAVGNAGIGSVVSPNYTVDTARPTANIVVANTTLGIGGTSPVTITFTKAVTGFTNADLTVANGTLSAVSSGDGGVTWTATLTPSAGITDSTNLITLDNTGIADTSGNAGTGTTDSNNYAIDTVRPIATVVVADSSLIAGETSLVTFTFSEAVSSFTTGDLAVANGILSSLATSDSITWTATLTPTAGVTDATNLISLDNTGLTDVAGNAGSGTTNSNNYSIDTTRPTATIVVADNALRAGETSLVTITFSEAVTGFTNADLAIANGTLTAVSTADGGITWTATFTPTAGITDATNLITLNNTGVQDAAGNTGTANTNSNNYAIDTARPTATIVVADSELLIGETSLVTITFSEAVTGFTNADLTIENGTLSAVTSGDGITWTANLTPTPNITDATNVITLNNSGVTDAAGNTGTGTTDSNNYAVTSLSISIAANAASAAEGTGAGNTAFTFTVSRTGSTTGAVTMDYAVSGAANAADFGGTLPAGQITIPDTQASAVLTINVSQDSTVEPDENFTVTLSNASSGYAISTATSSSTITNDDSATLTVAKVNDGAETNTPTNGLFRITQSAASGTATVINYSVGGTASSGSDFTALPGTATITAGSTTVDITVPVLSDAIVEGTETVGVTLTAITASHPNVALGATLTASLDITDNDTADVVIAKITDGAETNTPANGLFRVTQSAISSSNTVVTYTVGGTASSGSDYTALAGSVTISAGQTTADISLPVLNDVIVEATETVTVTLTGFTARDADISLGAAVSASADITDNDTATVTITKLNDGAESNTPTDGRFRVTLSAPSSSDTAVIFSFAGTASSVADYKAAGNAFFPAGQTVDDSGITVYNDNLIEPTETIVITLASLGVHNAGVSLAASPGNSATINITDNDIAASIAVNSGSGQSATVNTAFATPLVAIVSDSGGVAMAGASVTFTANGLTANGSFASSATVTTDSSGLATAPAFTANTVSGSYTVTAATPGVGPTAIFALTNTAAAATNFTFLAPSKTAIAGEPFFITVTAIDSFGNTVTGYPGTVHLTSSDPNSILPADSTFTAGVMNYSIIFATGGNQTLTFTDTVTPALTNTTFPIDVSPRADLAITLTDSPDPVNAGGNLTYTITIVNNGPSFADSPVVSLPLPANTTFVAAAPATGFWVTTAPPVGSPGTVSFSDTSLVSGGTTTFIVFAKVDLGVVNNSTLTATASAASATIDPNPGNNSATTTTLAKSGADLQISLADSPDPVVAGTNLTYTLQVANNGPLDADNVSIIDSLPAGTTFVSLSTPAGWTAITPAVGGTGSITITKPLFALGGSDTFTLVVKVAPGIANGAVLSDTASVTSTTIDIAPANNSATAITTVATQSDLAVQITGTPATAPKTSNVTYSITLTNNGPSDASAPNVSLAIPGVMTFVSATAPGGWSTTTPAVGTNGTVVFSSSSLASGATVNFTVVARVRSSAPTGSILTAIVTATATGVDSVPANNFASTFSSVGTVTPTAVQPVTTGFAVNAQTGLFDVYIKVTNTTPLPINGFRLHVNFDAYKAAYPSLRLENATSTTKKTKAYIDYPNAMAVNATVTVKLSFYTSTRTFPSPFVPVLTVDLLASSQAARIIGGGVQPGLAQLPDKTIQLAFPTVAGRWYRVRYSSDLEHWTDCQVPVQATSATTLWIDNGPPYTTALPAVTPSRFYLVNEIEAP